MHKKPPGLSVATSHPHHHVLGQAATWDGCRYLLDFTDADAGRYWFGQCIQGWLILRAILRHDDGDWSPAPMEDHSPSALRWIECEWAGYPCDEPTLGHACRIPTRTRPSKYQLRAAKVRPHEAAINAHLERVAGTRVLGPRVDGRPLYACSETVADAGIAKVHDARGRKRRARDDDQLLPRSLRVRDQRDEPRQLPGQPSVDLWARAMAENDPHARRFYLRRAEKRAPVDPWWLRPPPFRHGG